MGLDWIAVIRMRQEDREDYILQHCAKDLASDKSLVSLVKKLAPVWEKPCRSVGARQMKDLPDFRIRAYDHLAERKEQAFKELQLEPHLRNQPFIDHWLNRTVEEQMAEDGAHANPGLLLQGKAGKAGDQYGQQALAHVAQQRQHGELLAGRRSMLVAPALPEPPIRGSGFPVRRLSKMAKDSEPSR